MIVECPHCKARYSIPDEKAPRCRSVALCKKCQNQIVIRPEHPDEAIRVPLPEIEEPSELAVETFNAMLEADFPQVRTLSKNRYALWKIFSPNAEGGYNNPSNTQKFTMLISLAPVLDNLLEENEKVVGLAGVIIRLPVDWLLVNILLSTTYNHYALIATNQRLLLININKRMTKRLHYLYQVPYQAIRNLGRGVLNSRFVLQTTTGRKWSFKPVKQGDIEPLIGRIQELLVQRSDSEPDARSAEALCPACLSPLKDAAECCPRCKSLFRRPLGAALRSLFIPGWGNVYLGRPWIGLLEFFICTLIWLVVLDAIMAHHAHQLSMSLSLLLVYNASVGIVTFFSARRGYSIHQKAVGKET